MALLRPPASGEPRIRAVLGPIRIGAPRVGSRLRNAGEPERDRALRVCRAAAGPGARRPASRRSVRRSFAGHRIAGEAQGRQGRAAHDRRLRLRRRPSSSPSWTRRGGRAPPRRRPSRRARSRLVSDESRRRAVRGPQEYVPQRAGQRSFCAYLTDAFGSTRLQASEYAPGDQAVPAIARRAAHRPSRAGAPRLRPARRQSARRRLPPPQPQRVQLQAVGSLPRLQAEGPRTGAARRRSLLQLPGQGAGRAPHADRRKRETD